MRLVIWPLVLGGWMFGGSLGAQGNPNPMDSIRRLPTYRLAHDTVPLITTARIAANAPASRAAWEQYVAHSREVYVRDTTSMNRELRAAKRTEMIRAPYTHDFSVSSKMTAAWFATDSAWRMADVLLSFQAPNGGWSKHVDFTQHPRAPGESYFAESTDWEWISTIDNDATTEEIKFLSLADRARHDSRYVAAIRRGVDYLLESQYPNGCFPQVYPLEGSYHDAATFNDNATTNVLRLLREVAAGRIAESSPEERQRAGAAFEHGVDCILASQVRVAGVLTVWGQQHDPLTLEPTSARSYELTSLASLESADITELLMSLPSPSVRIVRAVYAAADWFRAVPISGYTYEHYQLTPSPGAAPLWGRLYEIGTNRVIMANRDGVKLYDWSKLTDRRTGYGWYTTRPAETLAEFSKWSVEHPRPQ